MTMFKLLHWVDLPARLLMASIFLVSGLVKLAESGAMQKYMEAFGVPGMLVWPAAAFELTCGVLLVIGLWVRPASVLLAGWCLLTASIFHTAWSDPTQLMMFMKNLVMAGGFLILAKHGATRLALDAWRYAEKHQHSRTA
jgi:putative oxidoreductase